MPKARLRITSGRITFARPFRMLPSTFRTDRANWIEKTSRLWYRRSAKGGNEVVLVDAEAKTKKLAFDHEKLATSLSSASGQKFTAVTLPVNALTFVDGGQAVQFIVGE